MFFASVTDDALGSQKLAKAWPFPGELKKLSVVCRAK
jgi:hypothetical protein